MMMMMMKKRTTTATLLYLVVISVVSAVNQVQAEESYAQNYDAMPRQTRSLLQKDEDANIACDEKCQQWVRASSPLTAQIFVFLHTHRTRQCIYRETKTKEDRESESERTRRC